MLSMGIPRPCCVSIPEPRCCLLGAPCSWAKLVPASSKKVAITISLLLVIFIYFLLFDLSLPNDVLIATLACDLHHASRGTMPLKTLVRRHVSWRELRKRRGPWARTTPTCNGQIGPSLHKDQSRQASHECERFPVLLCCTDPLQAYCVPRKLAVFRRWRGDAARHRFQSHPLCRVRLQQSLRSCHLPGSIRRKLDSQFRIR